MSQFLRVLFFSAATVVAAFSVLANGDPPVVQDLHSEYIVDSWQTEQGLPDNSITSIAQSADGYLWISAFNGLSRFDGAEFVTYDAGNTPAFSSSRFTEVHPDNQGRVWVTEESGRVSVWSHGHFRACVADDGSPVQKLMLRQDGTGDVWISNPNSPTNYYHAVGDSVRWVHTRKTFDERFGRCTDIDGRMWCIWSNCLCCLDDANPVRSPIPDYKNVGWRLVPSRSGGVWVISNRIRKFKAGQWLDFGEEPVETDSFNGFSEDRDGALWVGTDVGQVWRTKPNGHVQAFTVPGATTPQVGWGIVTDAEGNIWFGTAGSGLYRLKPRTFRNYDSHNGLASDVVRSVARDGAGNIWIASINRIDWIPNGSSEVQRAVTPVILPWELCGADDQGLWVGTFGEGMFRVFDANGRATRYPTVDGFMPPINAVFRRKNGVVALGTPRGLIQWNDGALKRADDPPGIRNMDVRAIAEDATGQLFLGMGNQGLYCSGSQGWSHFTAKDGLGGNEVRTLWFDTNSDLWIGTHGGGLSLLRNGKLYNFPAEPSGMPRVITSIIDDDLGYVWLASNRGLYRVNKKQLAALAGGLNATPDVFHYDRADGMGSSQCTGDHQPAACKAADGRLWFATMNGVTVVDPTALPFNPRPPPVTIEAMLADDAPLPLGTNPSDRVNAPAGLTRLEFRYAALTFVSPEKARFRYRLDGVDNGWIDAGNRRMADYTKLSPGFYRFHVIAANNDNVWNDQGASIDFHVLPLFWQTTWFRAASVLVVAGFAFWLYQRRVWRLLQQRLLQESFSRRLIESQENERKRMAAELHDSLGQGLLVVNNYAAMALKEAGTSEKLRERLHKVCDGATACIDEVRAIARSLRPYQLDRFGLTKTLEDLADLLSNTAGLKVETEIVNLEGIFSPEVEISVYRVAQEWLNNVAKHSGATQARVAVRRESAGVHFILEDNGVGFDYDVVMAGGGQKVFGLENLRERVRLLGGQFDLQTAPGKGTRWTVVIPYERNHGSDRR